MAKTFSIPLFGSPELWSKGLAGPPGSGWSLSVGESYSKPESQAMEQGMRARGAGSVGLYLGQNFDPRRLWNLHGVHP